MPKTRKPSVRNKIASLFFISYRICEERQRRSNLILEIDCHALLRKARRFELFYFFLATFLIKATESMGFLNLILLIRLKSTHSGPVLYLFSSPIKCFAF